MRKLTVGVLEEKLRAFPRGTTIIVGCKHCGMESSGTENILKIKDDTKQTFGYIEMELNSATLPEKEFFSDVFFSTHAP